MVPMGTPSIPARAAGEAYVLGIRCADDASSAFAACLRSTYRIGMNSATGDDVPATDRGFGCTVRSAQSLLMNLCRLSSPNFDTDESRLRFAYAWADGWAEEGESLSFRSCLSAPGSPSAWWEWWGSWQAVTTIVSLRSTMQAPLPGPVMLAATDGVIAAAAVRAAAGGASEPSAEGWRLPVVIFIPVSLGFSASQRKARLRDLAALAASPLFAGAVGGRKDHSVAFVGVRFQGDPEGGFQFLTLDPHVVSSKRISVCRTRARYSVPVCRSLSNSLKQL
jgi:hypothetical protein